MKEIINKVFEEKLRDGSIEKIISDKVDDMVKNICDSQMRYDGAARKALEGKLSPLMLEAIENCSFGNLVTKITMLINASIQDSDLTGYHSVLESIKSVYAADQDCERLRAEKSVKLSEIYEKYKAYLNEIYDKDDFENEDIYDDGEGPTATVECGLAVNEKEPLFHWATTTYEVELSCAKSNEDKSGDVHFELRKKWDGNGLYLRGDFSKLSLSDLRYCPHFILWLAFIEREYITVEVDIENDDDEVYIECR